jgi:hypothetical protein
VAHGLLAMCAGAGGGAAPVAANCDGRGAVAGGKGEAGEHPGPRAHPWVGELWLERVGGGLPMCADVLATVNTTPCCALEKPGEERSSERAKEHQGTMTNVAQKKRERERSASQSWPWRARARRPWWLTAVRTAGVTDSSDELRCEQLREERKEQAKLYTRARGRW